MTEPWLIDELAYAGSEHLDEEFVSGYDRKQGNPSAQEDLDELARLGALGPDSTVVDLGAGTGQFALAAAAVAGTVVAVDISEQMLTMLQRKAAATGLDSLRCVRAGLLSYEHSGPPADVVYCRNTLHQVPDFFKGLALHRMATMLRPGGILRLRDLVYDCTPAEAPAALERWMAAAVTDPAVGYTRDDFATHVRTEFSTYRWLLEPLLERSGFTILDSDVRLDVYATYTCRATGP
jgi:ubiquinone/menaquinone biosynthesis C-methylase UbiE